MPAAANSKMPKRAKPNVAITGKLKIKENANYTLGGRNSAASAGSGICPGL